jgi:hypothetical protein
VPLSRVRIGSVSRLLSHAGMSLERNKLIGRTIMYKLTLSGRDGKTQLQEFFKNMGNAIVFANRLMFAYTYQVWEDKSDTVYSPSPDVRLWVSNEDDRMHIEPINFRD